MKNLTVSEIRLSTGKRFEIVSNLQEMGLSVQDGLTNWLARTEDYSPECFCEYLMSKDPCIFAVTMQKFKELSK